jgi:predicted RNA binding protein YcfA (HicA-like mRNA interferase family)
MPRLRRVSGAEAIRALERLGLVQARQRGILRQAKVTPDEFIDNL